MNVLFRISGLCIYGGLVGTHGWEHECQTGTIEGIYIRTVQRVYTIPGTVKKRISRILQTDQGDGRVTEKEKFLSLKSYKEFDEKRDEFQTLKMDKDIVEHMVKIFPKPSNTKEELYKIPRSQGGTIGDGLAGR